MSVYLTREIISKVTDWQAKYAYLPMVGKGKSQRHIKLTLNICHSVLLKTSVLSGGELSTQRGLNEDTKATGPASLLNRVLSTMTEGLHQNYNSYLKGQPQKYLYYNPQFFGNIYFYLYYILVQLF
jgi:hypothetical protein